MSHWTDQHDDQAIVGAICQDSSDERFNQLPRQRQRAIFLRVIRYLSLREVAKFVRANPAVVEHLPPDIRRKFTPAGERIPESQPAKDKPSLMEMVAAIRQDPGRINRFGLSIDDMIELYRCLPVILLPEVYRHLPTEAQGKVHYIPM